MNAYASMIIFDRRDIRLTVATSKDDLRDDLVEFFNDNAEEWEVDELPEGTTLEEAAEAIREEFGHAVLIENTYVIGVDQ